MPTSRLHLRVGWWGLAIFLGLGLFLESLHGFKAGFYLDVSREERRLLWTLAHTHGALLSVLNLVFGMTVLRLQDWPDETRTLVSQCLLAATLLIPFGFLIAGTFLEGERAGWGVLLVFPGAALLAVAVAWTAAGAGRQGGARLPRRLAPIAAATAAASAVILIWAQPLRATIAGPDFRTPRAAVETWQRAVGTRDIEAWEAALSPRGRLEYERWLRMDSRQKRLQLDRIFGGINSVLEGWISVGEPSEPETIDGQAFVRVPLIFPEGTRRRVVFLVDRVDEYDWRVYKYELP